MRLTAVLAVCILMGLSACQTTRPNSSATGQSSIQYSGGDGTSTQQAVIISGARSSMEGVPAEYAWIRQNLPGAKLESQSLISGSRIYDAFEVTLPSGEKRHVYFDITSFFGAGEI
ncbi:hypothetical protein [Lysobacter niastensis]|uniref:Lipoprotein n=1 Tax=Lysobacter niastensis TaxID=380629 RepID=A0ABS0B8R6_9GAMM|nr:hypothetical protein [Lysobacter niastensis]MBF6023414.1 hypothetical protein [Lysobacter niastensis]